MNLPILSAEIVRRVQGSKDSAINLEQVVSNLIREEMENDSKNFKHLYEQQTKANEWQAEVIQLAEEYVLSGAYREEYLSKKWKPRPVLESV